MECTKEKVFFFAQHSLLLMTILSGIISSVLALLAKKWDYYQYTYRPVIGATPYYIEFYQHLWGYYLYPTKNNLVFDLRTLKEDYKAPIRYKLTSAAVLGGLAFLLQILHFCTDNALKKARAQRCLLLLVESCMLCMAAALCIIGSTDFKENHMIGILNANVLMSNDFRKSLHVDDRFRLESGYLLSLVAASIWSAAAAILVAKMVILCVLAIRSRVDSRNVTPVQNLTDSSGKKKKHTTSRNSKPRQDANSTNHSKKKALTKK